MRLITTVTAICFSLAFIAPSLAQQGSAPKPVIKAPAPQAAQNTPAQAIPASKDGVKITLPPAMIARAPTLTITQVDLSKARKVATAAKWGLTIRQEALKPSFWITPQQPYIAGGASLFIFNESSTTPNFEATPGMPYGSIAMSRTPTGAYWVQIKDAPARPNDWLLVECHLSGGIDYRIFSVLPRTPGSSGSGLQIMRTGLKPDPTLVSALIEPSTLSKRDISISGNGSHPGTWTFGGCEVTPINP